MLFGTFEDISVLEISKYSNYYTSRFMNTYYERYWEENNRDELNDFRYKWPIIKRVLSNVKNEKILDKFRIYRPLFIIGAVGGAGECLFLHFFQLISKKKE